MSPFLGANGAGKTTTMKSIAGLLKPKTGKIEFLGKDVTGLRPDQLLKQGMSLVPEGRAILSGMSVMENLEMGAYQRKDKDIEKDIENVMKQFPILKERKDQLGGTFLEGSSKCSQSQGLYFQDQSYYYSMSLQWDSLR